MGIDVVFCICYFSTKLVNFYQDVLFTEIKEVKMEHTVTDMYGGRVGKLISQVSKIDIHLFSGELFKMEGDRRTTRITCRKGVLWITQTDDPQDHLLLAGESFTINRPGHILIQGMPEAIASILN